MNWLSPHHIRPAYKRKANERWAASRYGLTRGISVLLISSSSSPLFTMYQPNKPYNQANAWLEMTEILLADYLTSSLLYLKEKWWLLPVCRKCKNTELLWFWPGLELRPLSVESYALPIKPPHLHTHHFKCYYFKTLSLYLIATWHIIRAPNTPTLIFSPLLNQPLYQKYAAGR